ncbi:unnamed protein product [Fraxinus pennsylvanica]|uniref:Uncharacterized protein n=1 Tax=Fraxinus pennsylvanica TaxID=56036 RepID=A0AAD2DUF7_9LAMI|nr:unnamed protein product [Fraxinus pennsylvanica]
MPSVVKSTRAHCKAAPLLPFEELVNEALLHVTSRRKAPPRKRSLQMENNELAELQTEYENLLSKFETHRTMSDIKIDYLTRMLAEADLYVDGKYKDSTTRSTNDISLPDENKSLRESDAILVIKQLQEKVYLSIALLSYVFLEHFSISLKVTFLEDKLSQRCS